MTFIALFTAAYRKFKAAIKNRQAYVELQGLSPAQLRDIGLRIENGYVVSEAEIEDAKDQCQQKLRLGQQERAK